MLPSFIFPNEMLINRFIGQEDFGSRDVFFKPSLQLKTQGVYIPHQFYNVHKINCTHIACKCVKIVKFILNTGCLNFYILWL